MEVSFFVPGKATPQGSHRAFLRGGRAVLVSKTRPLLQWRALIAEVSSSAMNEYPLLEGPLSVDLTFFRERPKSAPKALQLPYTRPDVDKLVRAMLDGMTGTIYKDDSQVVDLHAFKRFATEEAQVGVTVTVMTLIP